MAFVLKKLSKVFPLVKIATQLVKAVPVHHKIGALLVNKDYFFTISPVIKTVFVPPKLFKVFPLVKIVIYFVVNVAALKTIIVLIVNLNTISIQLINLALCLVPQRPMLLLQQNL